MNTGDLVLHDLYFLHGVLRRAKQTSGGRTIMRVELEGGPADGLREVVPDDITEIFLTDVGPASVEPDPFGGKSLGQMTYRMTERKTEDGSVIFEYIKP